MFGGKKHDMCGNLKDARALEVSQAGDDPERRAGAVTMILQTTVRTLDFTLYTMGILWEEHGMKQDKEDQAFWYPLSSCNCL